MGTAPTPQYHLHPWDDSRHLIKTLGTTEIKLLSMLINLFQEVPNTFQEVMNSSESEQWHAAAEDEYEGLIDIGIWKLVPRPKDCKTIKCRWTFVYKSDSWYKAQLVAKGYTPVQGIDYEETFSLVAWYESVQYLLAHTALLDWEIEAMDIKMAYLHRVLEEEIYMEQLEGFIAEGDKDKVCKLVRSLYRLKQAGQVWNRTFANTIKKKLGFEMIHSDVGVYVLHHWQGGITKIILILYVNNVLLLGEDQSKIQDVKHQLGKLYHMKDLGPASSYLGIQIIRDCKSRSIWIAQEAYIDNALKQFKLQDANNTKTSLPASLHLEKYEGTATTETKTQFQQMIRTLIYAAIGTRPNITFAATRLSRFNNNPLDLHIKHAKLVLRYLKGTKELHIKYNRCLNGGLTQTQIGVRITMIATPHQDMCSWWQMDAYLGHHSNRRLLHFQWEKLKIWN